MKSLSYYIRELNYNYGSKKVKWAIEYNSTISACEYFKSTLIALFGASVTFAIVAVFVGACLLVVLSPLVAAFSGLTGIMFPWFDYEMTLVGSIVAMILLTLLAVVMFVTGNIDFWPKWLPVGKWFSKHWKQMRGIAVCEKEKEPSILSIWYLAAKNKFCPTIDFSKHGKE